VPKVSTEKKFQEVSRTQIGSGELVVGNMVIRLEGPNVRAPRMTELIAHAQFPYFFQLER